MRSLKQTIILAPIGIVAIIVFGYFYGHATRSKVKREFEIFRNEKSSYVEKLFLLSKEFIAQDSSIEEISYYISNRDKKVEITMFDNAQANLGKIKINRDGFFLNMVIKPPSCIVLYKKNFYLKLANVFKGFDNTDYSLLFFESDEAKRLFFLSQENLVLKGEELTNVNGLFQKLSELCYIEGTFVK